MAKSTVVTTRLDAETAESLDALAERLERSRAWIVAKAVASYVKEKNAFLDFIQEGEDDINAGRWISHEDLVREIEGWRAKRQAA